VETITSNAPRSIAGSAIAGIESSANSWYFHRLGPAVLKIAMAPLFVIASTWATIGAPNQLRCVIHKVVLVRSKGFVLDAEDQHFGTDRCVLLPDLAMPNQPPVLDRRRLKGIDVIWAALVNAEAHPSQGLMVAGRLARRKPRQSLGIPTPGGRDSRAARRAGAFMRALGLLALVVVSALSLATCAAAAPQRDPTPNTPPQGRERQEDCSAVDRTCAAGALPRLTDLNWTQAEVAAFLDRAKQGTAAVERGQRTTRLLADCGLPGGYEGYDGKIDGRLWATNRPLLRSEEVGDICALATHLIAAFATHRAKFEAILLPLPCPASSDPMPAKGCVGRGLTGAERMGRARALQESLDPGRSTLVTPTARLRDTGESSRRPPPELPVTPRRKIDNAWLLDMWALTPDEYPATRWLNRLAGDCALAEQGKWLDSAYAWGGTREHPHTVVVAKPKPPVLHKGTLSLSSCVARPVFAQCFPSLVHLDPGCMRKYE
jgi:hypothetical protein